MAKCSDLTVATVISRTAQVELFTTTCTFCGQLIELLEASASSDISGALNTLRIFGGRSMCNESSFGNGVAGPPSKAGLVEISPALILRSWTGYSSRRREENIARFPAGACRDCTAPRSPLVSRHYQVAAGLAVKIKKLCRSAIRSSGRGFQFPIVSRVVSQQKEDSVNQLELVSAKLLRGSGADKGTRRSCDATMRFSRSALGL
jgi:hypothetical protein